MQNGLAALFSAIDTVLSLHYASSITTPKLNDVCARATSMCGKRITSSTLEAILAYFPQAYKIISYGRNSYDYAITVPSGMLVMKFGMQLPLRSAEFDRLLKSTESPNPVTLASIAIVETPLVSPVKSSGRSFNALEESLPKSLLGDINDDAATNPSSPTKRRLKSSPTKRSSPTKVSKASLLRNDASKFQFKEKIAAVEASKSGLSLLERIRLKEKQLKSQETPEARYHDQVLGKMPAVYDVIYELAPVASLGPKSHSFSLPKVISIVQDSFTFNIADTEVLDVIRELESRLGPEKLHILERGGVHAIKVFQLDRNTDLSLIR